MVKTILGEEEEKRGTKKSFLILYGDPRRFYGHFMMKGDRHKLSSEGWRTYRVRGGYYASVCPQNESIQNRVNTDK